MRKAGGKTQETDGKGSRREDSKREARAMHGRQAVREAGGNQVEGKREAGVRQAGARLESGGRQTGGKREGGGRQA